MFLQKLSRALRYLVWKNLARPLFIFNVMFVIDYNNQFTVVQRQIVSKLFVKYNKNKLLGVNPMGLSASRFDSLDIIDLQPVKKLWGLNQWELVTLGPTILILLP